MKCKLSIVLAILILGNTVFGKDLATEDQNSTNKKLNTATSKDIIESNSPLESFNFSMPSNGQENRLSLHIESLNYHNFMQVDSGQTYSKLELKEFRQIMSYERSINSNNSIYLNFEETKISEKAIGRFDDSDNGSDYNFDYSMQIIRKLNFSAIGYKGRTLFSDSTLYYGIESNLGIRDKFNIKTPYDLDSTLEFIQTKLKYNLGYLIDISDTAIVGFSVAHTDYLAGKFLNIDSGVLSDTTSDNNKIIERAMNSAAVHVKFKTYLNPELEVSIIENNQPWFSNLSNIQTKDELLSMSLSAKTEIFVPNLNLLGRLSNSKVTNRGNDPHISNESLMLGLEYSF